MSKYQIPTCYIFENDNTFVQCGFVNENNVNQINLPFSKYDILIVKNIFDSETNIPIKIAPFYNLGFKYSSWLDDGEYVSFVFSKKPIEKNIRYILEKHELTEEEELTIFGNGELPKNYATKKYRNVKEARDYIKTSEDSESDSDSDTDTDTEPVFITDTTNLLFTKANEMDIKPHHTTVFACDVFKYKKAYKNRVYMNNILLTPLINNGFVSLNINIFDVNDDDYYVFEFNKIHEKDAKEYDLEESFITNTFKNFFE